MDGLPVFCDVSEGVYPRLRHVEPV
jgi:hypothetical protein